MLIIRITRDELVAHGACAEGLAMFDSIAPSGVWESEWTPLHDAWIGTSGFARWLLDEGFFGPVNLRDAHIRNADVSGTSVAGADLTGANLLNFIAHRDD